MTLLADLAAFFREHQRCGDLDGAVEDDRVWMTLRRGDQPLDRRRLTRLLARVAALVRVAAFG